MRLCLLPLLACLATPALARPDARIVGGYNATIQEVPYQLSLQNASKHVCGATLVGPSVALTSAYCVMDLDVAKVRLRAGSAKLERGGTVLHALSVTTHPLFDAYTRDYDVAVVQVDGAWTPSAKVQPVPLVDEDYYPLPGIPVVVSGWGALVRDYGAPLSPQLQAVELPVVRSSYCNDGYGGDVSERMLCVGEAWKGGCEGDEGGPAVEGGALMGVVSWQYGCDLSGYPTVVASVASMRAWIRETAGV